jgi:hypothetical protein
MTAVEGDRPYSRDKQRINVSLYGCFFHGVGPVEAEDGSLEIGALRIHGEGEVVFKNWSFSGPLVVPGDIFIRNQPGTFHLLFLGIIIGLVIGICAGRVPQTQSHRNIQSSWPIPRGAK